MLGHRRHFPLPGRLYRHGAHFDFMMSFVGYEPTTEEMESFVKLLKSEIQRHPANRYALIRQLDHQETYRNLSLRMSNRCY